MWRSKKFIILAVLAAVMLTATIGGVVLAGDNADDGEPEAKSETLLKRVFEIYEEKTGVTIDQEALKEAFAQAQSEMRTRALENHLQSLVEEGRINQEQADDYLEWWQERPDIPAQFSFGGHIGFRSMIGPRRMRGFGWPCAPTE